MADRANRPSSLGLFNGQACQRVGRLSSPLGAPPRVSSALSESEVEYARTSWLGTLGRRASPLRWRLWRGLGLARADCGAAHLGCVWPRRGLARAATACAAHAASGPRARAAGSGLSNGLSMPTLPRRNARQLFFLSAVRPQTCARRVRVLRPAFAGGRYPMRALRRPRPVNGSADSFMLSR